ncbi:MAG: DUF6577 family protein [Bacteroidota bacterium]
MYTYAEKYYQLLKSALSEKPAFSIDDAERVLDSKRSSILWLLSTLTASGRLVRISRGVYSFSDKKISFRTPTFSPEINNAIATLRNEGVSFVLTGLDILLPFVQHQPNRLLHLLYTATGAGSWAQSLLKSEKFTPLLEPGLQEINTIIDVIEDQSEIIIIRERSSTVASKDSLATLERAFIDLYFEASRDMIPFSFQETAYIFLNMRSSVKLNTAQMLRYSHERTIRDEIEDILKALKDPRAHISSERAQKFLSILGKIR